VVLFWVLVCFGVRVSSFGCLLLSRSRQCSQCLSTTPFYFNKKGVLKKGRWSRRRLGIEMAAEKNESHEPTTGEDNDAVEVVSFTHANRGGGRHLCHGRIRGECGGDGNQGKWRHRGKWRQRRCELARSTKPYVLLVSDICTRVF
jgi:hypothetical protein